MNHVLENAVIAALILLCFVVPAVFMLRRGAKKRHAQLLQTLESAATHHQLNIARSEVIGSRMLGWDQWRHTLLYMGDMNEPVLVFNLKPGYSCRYAEEMGGSGIRQIALQLIDAGGRIVEQLPLYRQFKDNEMKIKQLAAQTQSWETFINQQQNNRQ